jgi:hypothetical protein
VSESWDIMVEAASSVVAAMSGGERDREVSIPWNLCRDLREALDVLEGDEARSPLAEAAREVACEGRDDLDIWHFADERAYWRLHDALRAQAVTL